MEASVSAARITGFNSIGRKLTLAICAIISVGFLLIVYFYAEQQERNILFQNERAIDQVLNSISEGLTTVMVTGSADVAEAYAEKLKTVKDVEDFRVLRPNGLEAFKDNDSIHRINAYRKEADFEPRPHETQVQVIPADDPQLLKVLKQETLVYYYQTRHDQDHLVFLLPIKNVKRCHRCHGKEDAVLGVLEFVSSLESAHASVRQTWLQAVVVLVLALALTLVVVTLVLRRYIIRPIEVVSAAMGRVAKGDLSQQIPILGRDELAQMAQSFNRLTYQLRLNHEGFASEHNKLETIIMGTEEGIVATDGTGAIVLVNTAAEALLGKRAAQIIADGFLKLVDDPGRIERSLDKAEAGNATPEIFLYNHRFLAVYTSTIHQEDGQVLGHSAIIRDMTAEKRLEQKLRELSSTDPLTGLAHRRALDETLKTEFDLAREQGRPLAILMFDVDHFKKFNDTYGHDQGDRVLQAFALKTREAVREVLDTVCRYGGEEFMVIARETPQNGGVILAERIRVAIEEMSVDGLRVTTSIGVAGVQETGVSDPTALIERADAALYEAKRAGRNKVMAAPSGEQT